MARLRDPKGRTGLKSLTEHQEEPFGEMFSALLETESGAEPNGAEAAPAPAEEPPAPAMPAETAAGPVTEAPEVEPVLAMFEPVAAAPVEAVEPVGVAEPALAWVDSDDIGTLAHAVECAAENPAEEAIPDEPVLAAAEPVAGAVIAEAASPEPAASDAVAEPVIPEAPPAVPEAAPAPEPPRAQTFEPSRELDDMVAAIDRENAFAGDREFSLEQAAPADTARKDGCIVFGLDRISYAVPIRQVLETDRVPRITPVPNVPRFVRGVTNLRGEIITVLDLRGLLGLDASEHVERARILVVRTAAQQTAALIVDEVRGTTELALGSLGSPAGPIQDKVVPLLMGIGEHQNQILNVLDVERLFQVEELQQFAA